MEKAAAYEATSYRGVFHFIRYIEKLKKYNTDFGEASRSADSRGNGGADHEHPQEQGAGIPDRVCGWNAGRNFNRQDRERTDS